MARLGRLFLPLLILAFAAGGVVHAAQLSEMVVKMSSPEASHGMPGCDGCGDDADVKSSCPIPCTISSQALVRELALPEVAGAKTHIDSEPGRLVAVRGPPDPFPPRSDA